MIRIRNKRWFKRSMHDVFRFLFQNGQLLVLIAFVLFSAFLGTVLYKTLSEDDQGVLSLILSTTEQPTDFIAGCRAVMSSAFFNCLLLAMVFLFGMTPYGCPLILGTTFVLGFRLGVLQSFTFLENGLLAVGITVLPHALISGTAILLASKTALHMSCVFSRQLLPSGAHCGSMWHDFKRYLIQFLIYIVIIFSAAIIEVLLGIVYQMM